MKKLFACMVGALMLSACASPPPAPVVPPPLISGIDRSGFDTAVRPQDNFYQAVNGDWLKKTEIPPDKSSYGALTRLRDDSEREQREIIEAAAADTQRPDGSDEQKIGDYYTAFLDQAQADKRGIEPLQAELARIDAISSRTEIALQLAHFAQIGVDAPFGLAVQQDAKDSTRYAVYLGQSGLGLPDRDYYLEDSTKFKILLTQYQAHVSRMLALAGDSDAKLHARQVVLFEKRLAEKQWSKVEDRDAEKTYNRYALGELPGLIPEFAWLTYATTTGFAHEPAVIIGEPSYFEALSKILRTTPLSELKWYMRWQLLHAYAPYLSQPFVDENFAFYGKALNGVPEDRPRWKRGVSAVDEALGFAVGKLYVAKYFPPENKTRMQVLVKNLLEEYRQSITSLDWMGAGTKQKALEKLAKFNTKIGYPDQWRDYSTLMIKPDDLVGNVMRANRFEFARDAAKLGKPIDRSEWGMTPQTVNAYYDQSMNEIVFPAAILQPPVFDAKADDAVNYGGIGAVIGHEISHGFDDQGSKFDAVGAVANWWTPEDAKAFQERVKALGAQYDSYEPLPGLHIKGQNTMGENIADNAGITIALKAYHISLNGKKAKVLDGYTGDQRFYLSYGQIWQGKYREGALRQQILSNEHSPPEFRAIGATRNQDEWYAAFPQIKADQKYYLPPDQRVHFW